MTKRRCAECDCPLTLLRRNKRSWEARKLCVRCDPPPRTPLLYLAIRKDLISPGRKPKHRIPSKQATRPSKEQNP